MNPKTRKPQKAKPAKAPQVPKPWDVPPPPSAGDSDINIIFASVGRALTNWEKLEFQLGAIFAILLGLNDSTEAPLRAYGSVITFKGRADMLAAAGEAYFLRHSMSAVETRFKTLLETARQLGGRRNEIAHGSVEQYRYLDKSQPRNTYVLIPGLYSTNKRKIGKSLDSIIPYRSDPKYIYSSVEIDAFGDRFKSYAGGVSTLWADLAHAYLKAAASIVAKIVVAI